MRSVPPEDPVGMNLESPKSDLLQLLRAAGVFLLAAALVAIPTGVLFREIRSCGNVLENGPVECMQLVLLLLASAAYALRARAARGGRGPARAFALCVLLLLAMCVRELDGFFDNLTGNHHFWSCVVAVVILPAACAVFRRFSRSVRDLARFTEGPEMPLFVSGLLAAVVFAQILGFKEIWADVFDLPIWQTAAAQNLMDGTLPSALDIPRHVKNIVEESMETASYLLLLFSALLPPAFGHRNRSPRKP